MPTDETLMLAVAQGDLSQLAELYRRYKRPLYGFLVNRGNGPAAAEDLLQATFERAIKYRTSFRAGMPFKGWVFTIARNLHADAYHRRGRLPVSPGADVERTPMSTPGADQVWEGRETAGQARAALAALPEHYREVVDLAWRRGLKYAEIATVLGISEANVKVRIHRATKCLRANYAKQNQL